MQESGLPDDRQAAPRKEGGARPVPADASPAAAAAAMF